MKFGNIEEAVNFPENQSDIPPLADIGRVKVIRLLGAHSSQECMGVGFLCKNRHNDLVNWRFPNFVLVMVIRGSGLYSDNHDSQSAVINI